MSMGRLVGQPIINASAGDGRAFICFWEDCDRRATRLYEHVYCRHDPREGCEHADIRVYLASGDKAHTRFAFCSHRHLRYHVNAEGRNAHESLARTGRAYGNLPAGERIRYG